MVWFWGARGAGLEALVKDFRAGSGPRLTVGLAAALLGLLLALALAGCGGMGGTVAPGPPPTATPLPDPAAILRGAAGRVAAAESLGFVLEHPAGATELAPGLLLRRAEGAANAPDKFRMALELEASGSFLELAVVGIGERAWMTNLFSGEWEAVAAAALPVRWEDAAAVFAAAIAAVEGPELTGAEMIEDGAGGYQAWVIRGQLPRAALAAVLPGTGAEGSAAVTIWADREERRLPRLRLAGPLVVGDLPEVLRVLTLEELAPAAEIGAPESGGGG